LNFPAQNFTFLDENISTKFFEPEIFGEQMRPPYPLPRHPWNCSNQVEREGGAAADQNSWVCELWIRQGRC